MVVFAKLRLKSAELDAQLTFSVQSVEACNATIDIET